MVRSPAERISEAILAQGSHNLGGPSEPTLMLLHQFVSENDLGSFSLLASTFVEIHPANKAFLKSQLPGNVTTFLHSHRGVTGDMFAAWQKTHPDWAEDLTSLVGEPTKFELAVERIATSVTSDE